jgi:Asp/Glu/hydantoin racemase
MCGVEAAREVVDIPVIGGFRASAFTAMMLSQKFSIITILESTLAMQLEHISCFGLSANFASIRAIDCPVSELEDVDKVAELVLGECVKAVEGDGAQSFILGCTGFIGIAARVREKLRQKYGGFIPVMDPNMTAMGYLVLLARNGLSQSRRCYSKVEI